MKAKKVISKVSSTALALALALAVSSTARLAQNPAYGGGSSSTSTSSSKKTSTQVSSEILKNVGQTNSAGSSGYRIEQYPANPQIGLGSVADIPNDGCPTLWSASYAASKADPYALAEHLGINYLNK